MAGPGSRPAIDPLTGGLTYIIGVTPDASFPAFSANGGGSVAASLGFLVSGDGFSDAVSPPGPVTDPLILPTDLDGVIVVNANSTPFTGTTASEPGDGFVDAAIPGPVFFGFETLGFGANSELPAGFQVGQDTNGQDALFASFGTTFFSASTIADAPFELFRVRTAALDLTTPAALAPALTLVTGSITAQSTDIGGSGIFALPITQSELFTVADVIPEPTGGVLLMTAIGATVCRRYRRQC